MPPRTRQGPRVASPVLADRLAAKLTDQDQHATAFDSTKVEDQQSSCGPRPTRRTKAEIDIIKAAIHSTLEAEHPATLRGLFYALVSRGVVPKTEAAYKSTVMRLAGEMRRTGELPYGWLADNTRMMRKPTSFDSIKDALRRTAVLYRRNLWSDADAYVEVWTEKDAISGVLYEVTSAWDVPLMVTPGVPVADLHARRRRDDRPRRQAGVPVLLRRPRSLGRAHPGARREGDPEDGARPPPQPRPTRRDPR